MKFPTQLRCLVAGVALCFAGVAHAETLTNDIVVALLEAGLGEEAVIAKIETSEGDFVTDSKTLLDLRAKGVPSSVVVSLPLNSRTVPHWLIG